MCGQTPFPSAAQEKTASLLRPLSRLSVTPASDEPASRRPHEVPFAADGPLFYSISIGK
jgi:hypothetical protein